MRGLGLIGLIAIAFGLVSYYVTGSWGWFGRLNLGAGLLLLVVTVVLSGTRFRGFGTPGARGILLRRAAWLAVVLAVGIALERGAGSLDLRFDWTLDQRYTLAPATREVLEALAPELMVTLYFDPRDPRIHGTRLLLESLEATGHAGIRERVIDEALEEVDRYGVASSNTVVLEVDGGARFEVVGRPTEGAIWEGLERLRSRGERRVIYSSVGAGEGNLARSDGLGFSGLATALQTEGYIVRDLILANAREIPEDAAALLVIAPERALRRESLDLLSAYLEDGGGLIALLEPGSASGVEERLAGWGFDLPDGVVVDPASGPIEGAPDGVNPLAYAYAEHPITAPLDANRMTFFLGARPVSAARKPSQADRLRDLVFSSPRSWLSQDISGIARGFAPRDRDGRPTGRFGLLAVGSYPRPDGEARIAVFGDSDFASNGYLRSLFNLDLMMNTVGWVASRAEFQPTRRANILTVVQRPLTPIESLRMFYGVGLLLPELFLIAAAVAWMRRRGA